MKVLIACEFSGIVREAFRAQGHDAWSCDYEPTEVPGQHILNDVRNVLDWNWDLMIAHPPCTHLASSGARWWKTRQYEQRQALDFVRLLMEADIPKIAIENPVGIISTKIRKPSQIIQPYQFGDPAMKTTCLWLKGLPPLFWSHVMAERRQECWLESSGPNQARNRSRTYPGIALAMAEQWGVIRVFGKPMRKAA